MNKLIVYGTENTIRLYYNEEVLHLTEFGLNCRFFQLLESLLGPELTRVFPNSVCQHCLIHLTASWSM